MQFRNLALAAGIAAAASAAAIPSPLVPNIPGTRAMSQTPPSEELTRRQASGSGQSVLYWGQNNAERTLGSYCSDSNGPDIVVLAFLYEYGNSQTPYGNFGEYCVTSTECGDVEEDIAACQAAGKKVLVSLGGAVGAYSLTSDDDANATAQDLWDMFGNPSQMSNGSAIRPFGEQVINGFDLDIEVRRSF